MSPSPTLVADESGSGIAGKYPPPTSKPASAYTLRKLPWQPYVTPFERIIDERYAGSGTEADPYIVDWVRNDPEDPQGWPTVYKWATIANVSLATLAVALSSSAYSGGVQSLVEEFGASTELLTAGISLFVVGFATGPLLWAPLSEVYGRRNIFILSYFFLTIWSMAAALSQTVAQLLVFRFLCGFFGSSPLANAGGVITDVLDAKSRGVGMAIFAASPFAAPALGPIVGGFIGLTQGWRWVMWFLTIFCGFILFVLVVSCPETYAPTILRWRADRLSNATGKIYRFRADAKGKLQLVPLFKAALSRPWKFLIYEPIVIILTIYTAVIYGILYLNFSAYPIVFQRGRGWNTGVGGLAFLGILVGTILAVIISITYVQPQYLKTLKKRGHSTPEDRLPPAIWGGVFIVIGLAGFAATDGPNVHWIAPIIFGVPFGIGVVVTFLATLAYLVDAYTIYAASVLAANSVLRSLFGAAFPLFTPQMYERLGVHWAAALPGFIALACIPFAWYFWKHGASIRARCRYAADAERQMALIMAAQKKRQDANAAADLEAAGGGPDSSAESGAGAPGAAPANEKTAAPPASRPKRSPSVASRVSAHESELLRTTSHNSVPVEPQHRYNHEWSMYEALAERDEVDLDDEERMHLERLHEKFNYARHKEKRSRSPVALKRPAPLPEAEEEH